MNEQIRDLILKAMSENPLQATAFKVGRSVDNKLVSIVFEFGDIEANICVTLEGAEELSRQLSKKAEQCREEGPQFAC